MTKQPYYPNQWEQVNCPFCGSPSHHHYEKFGDELQFTFVKCDNCHLVYQSPRPKYGKEFLEDAYGNYELWEPGHAYRNSNHEDFQKEVEEIIKFDHSRTAMLDVGTAMGDFLYYAKPYYEKIVGIEIADNMAQYAREHLPAEIIESSFDQAEIDQKFSCIHMSHVIEHIPNPNEWMVKARDLLEPDGILVICVPNVNSLGRRLMLFQKRLKLRNGKWKETGKTPDHLFEPSMQSFKYLFQKHKWKVIHHYTYSRSDMTSESGSMWLYQRGFKLGTNLRIYLRPEPIGEALVHPIPG